MKKFKTILGCGLIICGFLAVIGCIIASIIFQFKNPFITDLGRFLMYPEPTIIGITSILVMAFGLHLASHK